TQVERLRKVEPDQDFAALQRAGVERSLIRNARVVCVTQDPVGSGSGGDIETGSQRGIVGVVQIVVEAVHPPGDPGIGGPPARAGAKAASSWVGVPPRQGT